MALSKLKVCLIGAGPSGMSVMFHMNRLAQQGLQVPEIKCYEKQSNWGGLWNYSWRTGKFDKKFNIIYKLYNTLAHSNTELRI